VTPVQAAIDPTTRNDNTNFGEDLQRGYKQTAVFASADFDLIPKVLTVTGGTRYFRYVEQEVGSQYSDPTSCVNIPNGQCFATPINYSDHHATFTGFKSRGNITWHITPDAMFYYTYSQGYRPGTFNRVTGGRTPVWVDPSGVPLPMASWRIPPPAAATPGLQPSLVRHEADAVHQALERGTRLAAQQRNRLQVGVLRSSPARQRLRLQDGLGERADADLQPAGVWQHDVRCDGSELSIKGGELQLAFKPIDSVTLMANMSYNDSKQTTSPCIRSSGKTPITPANPTPAGACITQVRSSGHNVAVLNALGAIGSTPAFSPSCSTPCAPGTTGASTTTRRLPRSA